jgi:Mrp family chromosome partitioning ATPase
LSGAIAPGPRKPGLMKPTSRDFALGGMNRTIDFLRHKEIRIMGLVTMMDGYLCPSCGLVTHQLLFPKLAMEKVPKVAGRLS